MHTKTPLLLIALLFLPIASALDSENLTLNRTAWYTFEPSTRSGNIIYDLSLTQNNLTLYADAQNKSGKIGHALYCDGTGDYAITQEYTPVNYSGDRTYTFWSNITAFNSNSAYLYHGGFSSNTLDAVKIYGVDGGWQHWGYDYDTIADLASTRTQAGQWNMLTIVINQSTTQLYLNATEVNYTDYDATNRNTLPSLLSFCAKSDGSTYFYTGFIDEFLQYNRVLTPAEIAYLYNDGDGITAPDLLIPLDNCSTYNQIILNYTLYDEDLPFVRKNATVDIIITYTDTSVVPHTTSTYHKEYYLTSEVLLCSATMFNISYDAYFLYSSGDVTNRYYAYNQSNAGSKYYDTIYLHNDTTNLKDVVVTAREASTYNYYNDVVTTLQRYYVDENQWRDVQMDLSGDYGTLHFYAYEDDVDYRLSFSDTNNNVLKVTNMLKFSGDTDGIYEITALLDPYSATSVSPALRYNYSYSNSTGYIYVDWSDDLAITSNFRMLVTQETGTRTNSVCDVNTSAASGSMNCEVSSITGNVLVRFYSSASPESAIFAEWVRIKLNDLGDILRNSNYPDDAVFWIAGITITLAAGGASFGPVGSVIGAILGTSIGYILSMTDTISPAYFMAMLVVGVIIIFLVKRK